MSDMPAVCLQCGSVFSSSAEEGDPERLIIKDQPIIANKSCSRCQVSGNEFSRPLQINSAINILARDGTVISDFEELGHLAAIAVKTRSTREEVTAIIRARINKFSELATLLPRGGADLYMFLGFVMAFTQLIVAILALKYIGHHYSIHYQFY